MQRIIYVILANEASLSTDIYGHLEEVTSTFVVDASEPNCAVAWEVLAEAAAMEFLFPAAERISMNMASVAGEEIDAIAAHYDIPRLFVETYCSEHHYAIFEGFEKLRTA